MMHDFLINNKIDLTRRCRDKVSVRSGRSATTAQLQDGIPIFLDQLIRTLRIEYAHNPSESMSISGSSDGLAGFSEIGISAAKHGKALLELGFTIDQVVHDYGDLCQAITDLAIERDAPFRVDEFRTLNRCLDNAIAEAVNEFSYQRLLISTKKYAREIDERAKDFAHDLRNILGTAALAFSAAKSGNLSLTGSTGAILERSLLGMSKLIEDSHNGSRNHSEEQQILNSFSLSIFVNDVVAAAKAATQAQSYSISVPHIDVDLALTGNRKLLVPSIAGLLVTMMDSIGLEAEIKLCAYSSGDMVRLDFFNVSAFLSNSNLKKEVVQHADNTGKINELDACINQVINQCGGIVDVYDVPHLGGMFSIKLPRFSMLS